MYVKTYSAACPVCKGEVKGNNNYLYLCRKCKFLYKLTELRPEKTLENKETDNEHLIRRWSKKNI